MIGLAFGNDVDGATFQITPFESIQRSFIQLRFNSDSTVDTGCLLEINQANNGVF